MSNEQIYYDILKRIAKGYHTPDSLRKSVDRQCLDYQEALEMAYENMQAEAAGAIHGERRPKDDN